MEAFLTEVRSVKLKKVSGTLAPPLSSDHERINLVRPLSSTVKGEEALLRKLSRRKSLSELDSRAGQKRKRNDTDTEGDAEPGMHICLWYNRQLINIFL